MALSFFFESAISLINDKYIVHNSYFFYYCYFKIKGLIKHEALLAC